MAEIKLGKFSGVGGVIVLVIVVGFYFWQNKKLDSFIRESAPKWVADDLQAEIVRLELKKGLQANIVELNPDDFQVVSVRRRYKSKDERVMRVTLRGPQLEAIPGEELVYTLHIKGGPLLGYRINRGNRE